MDSLIYITGENNNYGFHLRKNAVPRGSIFFHPTKDQYCTYKLLFSDGVIKLIQLYFKYGGWPNLHRISNLSDFDFTVTSSDMDTLNYRNRCMDNASDAFLSALETKPTMKLLPKYKGKNYPTNTFMRILADYLGLEYLYSYSFGLDYKLIQKNIKSTRKKINRSNKPHSQIEMIIEQKQYIQDKLDSVSFENLYGYSLVIASFPLIKTMYEYFRSIYLENKKYPCAKIIREYNMNFVCTIESMYLRMISFLKYKSNKTGFVHFYKYFRKNCECFRNTYLNSLNEELEYVLREKYFGCSPRCQNFYENKFYCGDLDLEPDVLSEEEHNDNYLDNESHTESEEDVGPDNYMIC